MLSSFGTRFELGCTQHRVFPLALSLFLSMIAAFSIVDKSATASDLRADSIGSLELRDRFGKTIQLSQFRDSKILVIAFLGTECPLAKLYGPKLQAFYERFQRDGVVMVGGRGPGGRTGDTDRFKPGRRTGETNGLKPGA